MSWPSERLLGSIRARLLLFLCGGLGLLMLGLFALLDYAIDRQIYGRLDRVLLERAHDIARSLEAQPGVVALTRLGVLQPSAASTGHGEFFEVRDAAGRVLLGSPAAGGAALTAAPAAVSANAPYFFDLRLPDGHHGRAVALRMDLPGGASHEATLIVAQEREFADELEGRVHVALVVGAFGAGTLAALLAVLAVRGGLRPLIDFGRNATTGAAVFAQALPVARMPRELKPFARRLNSALEGLEQALMRERRFARDVAHELRTPLAELKMATELARRDAEDPAPLDDALTAIERMRRCIDALLALSRYEAGLDSPQAEPLELAAKVRQSLAGAGSLIARRGLDVAAALPEECWVSTDPALLERILDNLLLNAAEYAPPHGRLCVLLEPDADGWRLRIGNPAPELDAEDLAHLGERFWRKSAAREASRHGGLGLALARTLAGVLGLELTFVLEDGMLWARLARLRGIATEAPSV